MKRVLPIILIIASACSKNEKIADAYGNFEATEIKVSAAYGGKLINFKIDEGSMIKEGQVLGYIDTTKLHLQRKQLMAKGDVIRSKAPNISTEIEVLLQQKKNLKKEEERFEKLVKEGAAPSKQLDDIKDQLEIINRRINVVQSQNQPLYKELELVNIEIEQVEERIQDAIITSPISGTVLLKTAEEGEHVTPGMPLLHLANLDHLVLRAYVSGTQLDDISIGQKVKVLTDKSEESYNEYTGEITWISDDAEFTPKVIQTKEERTDLVYAIKVKVPNNGSLKIGMPGEVVFNSNNSSND